MDKINLEISNPEDFNDRITGKKPRLKPFCGVSFDLSPATKILQSAQNKSEDEKEESQGSKQKLKPTQREKP